MQNVDIWVDFAQGRIADRPFNELRRSITRWSMCLVLCNWCFPVEGLVIYPLTIPHDHSLGDPCGRVADGQCRQGDPGRLQLVGAGVGGGVELEILEWVLNWLVESWIDTRIIDQVRAICRNFTP